MSLRRPPQGTPYARDQCMPRTDGVREMALLLPLARTHGVHNCNYHWLLRSAAAFSGTHTL
jgi:hypothetical protein